MHTSQLVQQISVAGASGAGKGSAGKLVATELGFTFVSLGEIFRTVARNRGCRDISELHDRAKSDPSIDLDIDAQTKAYGQENDRFIFDARLGWYWIPRSFKVFLSCSDPVRFERIARREDKSVEVVRAETLAREEKMRVQYLRLYNIDDFMRQDSDRFDLIVDTTLITPDEVADHIVQAFNRRIS